MNLVKPCVAGLMDGGHVIPMLGRMRQQTALRRLCLKTRSLVLTYDDGPGPTLTTRLLDLLSAESQKAVFFALGCKVARNAGLVDRMVAEGHELGCHGQDHLHAWQAWPWEAVRDINLGYQSMSRWIKPDAIFRPPYGKLTLATLLGARRRGRRLGWWTVESGDTYSTLPTNPELAAQAIARAGGGVVLMHDFDRAEDRMNFVLSATESLLLTARREGLTIRRLCDLSSMQTNDSIPCCPSSSPPITSKQ